MRRKYIFLIFSLFFLLTGCKKEKVLVLPDHELPAATTSGKNKVGCLINGKTWIPKLAFCFWWNCPEYFRASIDFKAHTFRLHFQDTEASKTQENEIEFTVNDPKIGRNLINYNEEIFQDRLIGTSGAYYELDTTQTRHLILTKIDTTQRILSGTFEFTVINKKLKDTLNITYGRFDAGIYYTTFR